jgi:hypothetical protein
MTADPRAGPAPTTRTFLRPRFVAITGLVLLAIGVAALVAPDSPFDTTYRRGLPWLLVGGVIGTTGAVLLALAVRDLSYHGRHAGRGRRQADSSPWRPLT